MLNGFYAGIPDAVEGASYRQRGGVPAAVDIGVQPVGAEASPALCTLYHGPCAGIDGVAATRRSADHPWAAAPDARVNCCPVRRTRCGSSPVLMGLLEAGGDDVPQEIR